MTSRYSTWLAAAALFVAVAPATRAAAQQDAAKPAAVLSVASIDRLLSDFGYLTRAAGTPEVGGILQLMAGQYIEGINTRQPAGLVVSMNTPAPSAIAFVAVSDFDLVLAKIKEAIAEPEDVGGGVKKLSLEQDVFFKHEDGWVFVSDSAANLQNLPENPSRMLGNLARKYQLAVRINVQSIPAMFRELAVKEMKRGFEQSLNGAGLQVDENLREAQQQVGRQSVENIELFFLEADELTLGWGVDQAEGAVYLDASITVLPHSKLAEQLQAAGDVKTSFSGFQLEDAAATLQFSSKVVEEDIAQLELMMQMARTQALRGIEQDNDLPNDEARQGAKKVVNSLMDVFEQTLKAGKIDGGAALVLEQDRVQFVAGGFVADGAEVEKNLKEIVALGKQIEDDPVLDTIQFNTGTIGNVNLHKIRVPVPEHEEEARKVFGEELEVVVGTGPQSAYLALGRDSEALLRRVVEQSKNPPAESAPLRLELALGPILKFASSVENDPTLTALANALKDGHDHIQVTGRVIDRGFTYRILVQDGALKLIGQGAKLQGGGEL